MKSASPVFELKELKRSFHQNAIPESKILKLHKSIWVTSKTCILTCIPIISHPPVLPPLLPMPAVPGYCCAQPRLQDLKERVLVGLYGMRMYEVFQSDQDSWRFVNPHINMNDISTYVVLPDFESLSLFLPWIISLKFPANATKHYGRPRHSTSLRFKSRGSGWWSPSNWAWQQCTVTLQMEMYLSMVTTYSHAQCDPNRIPPFHVMLLFCIERAKFQQH